MSSNGSIGSLPRGAFCSYFTLASWAAQSWRFYQRRHEGAFVVKCWLEAVSQPYFRGAVLFQPTVPPALNRAQGALSVRDPPAPAWLIPAHTATHWGHLSGFLTSTSNANFPTTLMILSSVGSQKLQHPGFLSLRVRFGLTAEPTLIPGPDEGKKAHRFVWVGLDSPTSTGWQFQSWETVLTNTYKFLQRRAVYNF